MGLSAQLNAAYTTINGGLVFDFSDPANRSAVSPNQQVSLNLQGDGNLVLYQNGSPEFDTKTNNTTADRLFLQSDGNLVLLLADGTPAWSSHADPGGGHTLQSPSESGNISETLRVDDSGALKLYHGDNLVWSRNLPPVRPDLMNDETLETGEYLQSGNQRYRFEFSSSGALRIRDTQDNATLWETPVSGGDFCVLQGDGNLVLKSGGQNGTALWSSWTHGDSDIQQLFLDDDGTLKLLKAGPTNDYPEDSIEQAAWIINSGLEFRTIGGVNEDAGTETVSVRSKTGDVQILSIGVSSDTSGTDQSVDFTTISNQGFILEAVRGVKDRRVEVWTRVDTGSGSYNFDAVTIPVNDGRADLGVAYAVTTITGGNVNPGNFTSATDQRNSPPPNGVGPYNGDFREGDVTYTIPGGSGFVFVSLFCDDSTKILDAKGGDVLFERWGFGDWDGFSTILYRPGEATGSIFLRHLESDLNGGNIKTNLEWNAATFKSGSF